jgi:hypothetical protein
MIRSKLFTLSAIGALLGTTILTAAIGTTVRLSVAELVLRADLCLEGRVTAARAVLEPGKRIDTEYTISVERTFWGEAQASRAIRIPGGVLPNGSGMLIPGLPSLAVGEEAILFLSKSDVSGMRMPIGLAQGRMVVATDRFGKKRVVRDQAGLAWASSAGGTGSVQPADDRSVVEYAAVVADIEAAVAAKRAGVKRGQ